MTKEELRTQYITDGWEVQPVANWTPVSAVEGLIKYDVNVVSPDNKFFTAQVVVKDDGGVSENAVPEGQWKNQTPSFAEALRTFLDTREVGSVFAIAVSQIREADEVAEAEVYTNSASDVVKDTYVVKRRNDTFDFKKLV